MFKKLRRRFRRRLRRTRRRFLQYSNEGGPRGFQVFATRLKQSRHLRHQRPIPLAGAVKTVLTGSVPVAVAATTGRQLLSKRSDYARLESAAIKVAKQAVRRVTGFGGY